MSDLDQIIRELVIANRILAHEEVVDAYGHVSVRHPDDPGRYLLARSVAPELVERDDIVDFRLDGTPTREDKRAPYLERFIHGAIYEARPDVMAVVHAHAEAVLPFTITRTPLRPVIHSGSFMGAEVPVWDIADQFGDTNLLVTNMAQGRDLARRLGPNNVALMRGHGFAAAARSLIEVVRMSVYTPRNARPPGRPCARRGEAAVARRDRRAQRRVQAELPGDSAGLGILGPESGMRRHARALTSRQAIYRKALALARSRSSHSMLARLRA